MYSADQNKKNDITYTEIAKTKISDTRNLIISACSKGGFTLAQQLEITEGKNKTTTVFMKGAIHIDSIDAISNVIDMLEDAIEACEDSSEEPEK